MVGRAIFARDDPRLPVHVSRGELRPQVFQHSSRHQDLGPQTETATQDILPAIQTCRHEPLRKCPTIDGNLGSDYIDSSILILNVILLHTTFV
ncbi:unnamed protein product [Protopolystoma xenopodis]|uniref:Uncharacterized protein n=1 Tax=Protopolystoma xenopodis TaxID=117903 RepID=A0A448X8Z8_9PLAT|nr:unnamed protein product [Protopolystoma xenopodis]